MNSGLYKITNIINGKFYIGSSNHIEHRISRHKASLRYNKHRNNHLQSAWNKYGENAFHFEMLIVLPVDYLKKAEQAMLDMYWGVEQCYNIAQSSESPMRGRKIGKFSPEHINKLKKPKSALHKQHISEAKKGKVFWRKFDDAQREEIRMLRSSGLAYRAIAEKVGCSIPTARSISLEAIQCHKQY